LQQVPLPLRDSGKNAEMFGATAGGHGNMKGPGWENGAAVLFEFLARNLSYLEEARTAGRSREAESAAYFIRYQAM
ncbi:MAG: hypothetical protein O7G86_02475, partial [Gammaproteobacteria bacterium]|nr:hypothetical protein [Gammaproteobacteria bacterium]